MKSALTFTGTLKTIEPLTAVYPGTHPDNFTSQDGSRFPAPKFLPRMGDVPLVFGDPKKAVWSFANWEKFRAAKPFLQGSAFRGALRRCAFDVICDALEAAGQKAKFNSSEFYMLVEGFATSTNKKGSADKVEEIMKPQMEMDVRLTNPMMALFGAWKMPAELGTGLLFGHEGARLDTVLYRTVRTNDLARSPHRIERLSEPDRTSALEGNFREEVKGERVEIQSIAGGFEAIAPSQTLECRMTLSAGSSDSGLGLLLCALERFSQSPRIGGHFAAGCGLVSGKWNITCGPYSMGDVSFDPLREDIGRFQCNQTLRDIMDGFIAGIGQFDFHKLDFMDTKPKGGKGNGGDTDGEHADAETTEDAE